MAADGVSGISEVEPVVAFEGSGSRGPFPLTTDGGALLWVDSGEIHAFRINAAGDITDLTEGVDYDLTATLSAGLALYSGSLTLSADQAVLAEGERLIAYRLGALDQTFTLPYNTKFASQSFIQLQNRWALRMIELRAMIQRAPLVPYGETVTQLPDKVQRKGKVLAGDPTTGELQMMVIRELADADGLGLVEEFEFVAEAGGQSAFTLSGVSTTSAPGVLVWAGGARQASSTYTLEMDGDDTILTLAEEVDEGVAVNVLVLGSIGTADVVVSAEMADVVGEETTDGALHAMRGVREVASLTEFQAITIAEVVRCVVAAGRTNPGDGYEGTFVWLAGDQSASVTSDPAHAVYVPLSADPTGALGAYMRVYDGAVLASWFNPTANGVTDDLVPLTRFVNFLLSSAAVEGEALEGRYQAKSYAISGALPKINRSGVVIRGSGKSARHTTSPNIGGGTLIVAITNSGFKMQEVGPDEGASARNLDSVEITGIHWDGAGRAAYGLYVKSVVGGFFDCSGSEFTTIGCYAGPATTLGDVRDVQNTRWRWFGWQLTTAAPSFFAGGDASANTSFNVGECITVISYDAIGVVLANSDNNDWNVRVYNAGGAASYSVEFRGGATLAQTARGERMSLSANLPAVVRGTTSYTVAATNIVLFLDKENGSPDPVIETGASCFAITRTHWNYISTLTSFVGALFPSANLAGFITNLGGSSAVRAALGLILGTDIYSKAAVDGLFSTLAGGVTTAHDTLKEIEDDLALKAPLASPTFTGTPLAPTALAGTNTTQIATTAFVKTAIDAVLGGVSSAFDTLVELANGKQDVNSNLTALSGLTGVADRLAYFTGAGAMALATFTSVARTLLAASTKAGQCQAIGTRNILAQSAVAGSNHTGTTAETVIPGGTISIPANSIGPNGSVHVRATFTVTGTAAAKNIRMRLGTTGNGLTGDALMSAQIANTTTAYSIIPYFANRNATNSQVGIPSSTPGSGASTTGGLTGTKDTTANLDLVFTVELVNSADAVKLESYVVEIIYGA